MKFETKAVWVGQAEYKATGATIVPIYQTSGRSHGFVLFVRSRCQNEAA